jgi:hypothetical protein
MPAIVDVPQASARGKVQLGVSALQHAPRESAAPTDRFDHPGNLRILALQGGIGAKIRARYGTPFA